VKVEAVKTKTLGEGSNAYKPHNLSLFMSTVKTVSTSLSLTHPKSIAKEAET
jgi:hypothetical protein